MAVKQKKSKKCQYAECFLPKDNKIYWWQLAFMAIGILGFFLVKTDFSFLNIFLFLVPVTLDLVYNDIKYGFLKIIRKIYIALNLFCVSVCFIGFTMLNESGLKVTVDTLFFESVDISSIKSFLFLAIVINIMVPIILLIGRPCLKNLKVAEDFLNMQ